MTMLQTLDTDLQRSVGSLRLKCGEWRGGAQARRGLCKTPHADRLAGQAPEAIIINTSGGLAGGDRFEIDVQAASDLCLTTQAAEKIYRSLSDETRISTRLSGQGEARLLWLPQETILFDGAGWKDRLRWTCRKTLACLRLNRSFWAARPWVKA